MVDTLPNVQNPPVPTALSGTGWTCTLATLTCTRADALASGSSYPPITLTVNIPKNIQNNFTNTATVSGGGDVNPTNNTATDSVSLGPPIVMTPQSGSVNVVHGNTANMVINVDAPDPTLGVITFSCSGLPGASTCNFSPGSIDPATTPGPTAMTVSVFTTKGTASLSAPARPGAAGRNPLYAMFAFPVFGMMLAGFGGQRRKGVKRLTHADHAWPGASAGDGRLRSSSTSSSAGSRYSGRKFCRYGHCNQHRIYCYNQFQFSRAIKQSGKSNRACGLPRATQRINAAVFKDRR